MAMSGTSGDNATAPLPTRKGQDQTCVRWLRGATDLAVSGSSASGHGGPSMISLRQTRWRVER